MNSDHVAVIREALELLHQNAGHHVVVPGGLQFVPDVAKRATIDAALAALDEDVWEPVNERFLLTHDTGLLDHPKLFVRWNADDESILVGKDDGSFYHCPLPPDIRLCRKRTPAQG